MRAGTPIITQFSLEARDGEQVAVSTFGGYAVGSVVARKQLGRALGKTVRDLGRGFRR